MLKQLTLTKKVILLFLLVSVFSFSKDFWEKSSFTVNITEDANINGTRRSKSYVMAYNSGTMKLTITARGITSKKTQTKNGNTFTFSSNWLTSIKSSGTTVNFSDYKTSNGYSYPTKISVSDGSSQIIYRLSNFR